VNPEFERLDKEKLAGKLAWIVLSRLPQIGGRRCASLVKHFGTARAALEAPEGAWAAVIGRTFARKARGRGLTLGRGRQGVEALRGNRGVAIDLGRSHLSDLVATPSGFSGISFWGGASRFRRAICGYCGKPQSRCQRSSGCL
jgi:hypothetical protein